MKVQRLDGGSLTAPAAFWRQGDEPDRPLTVPVPAYFIEAGTERILVDTGLHPAAVENAAAHYGDVPASRLFEFAGRASLAQQLDLTTVTRVVLTHLHFDHAGALALVPDGIPVVVQRREWEAAHEADAIARNFYLSRDYAGRDVVLVDGDHDLLGDGSIELLLTPGHTPGHQSVRAGDLVIGGDVALFDATFDDLRFPALADDRDAQARSLDRLRALREAGLKILPGHDPQVLRPGETLRSVTAA